MAITAVARGGCGSGADSGRSARAMSRRTARAGRPWS